MAEKRQTMPVTVEPEHWQWMKATLEQVKYVLGYTCMTVATEVGMSPMNIYGILTNSFGKQKKFVPSGLHVLNED